MNTIRTLFLILFISIGTVCNAEQSYIDSCVLRYASANWAESCYIKIAGDSGYIKFDKLTRAGERIALEKDTCSMILNGLEEIFIEKKYPIIESKTKAADRWILEYPFFEVTIYYKNKKFHKFMQIAWRNESYIYHFSKEFSKFWNIIEKISDECYSRERNRRYEERRRKRNQYQKTQTEKFKELNLCYKVSE